MKTYTSADLLSIADKAEEFGKLAAMEAGLTDLTEVYRVGYHRGRADAYFALALALRANVKGEK